MGRHGGTILNAELERDADRISAIIKAFEAFVTEPPSPVIKDALNANLGSSFIEEAPLHLKNMWAIAKTFDALMSGNPADTEEEVGLTMAREYTRLLQARTTPIVHSMMEDINTDRDSELYKALSTIYALSEKLSQSFDSPEAYLKSTNCYSPSAKLNEADVEQSIAPVQR